MEIDHNLLYLVLIVGGIGLLGTFLFVMYKDLFPSFKDWKTKSVMDILYRTDMKDSLQGEEAKGKTIWFMGDKGAKPKKWGKGAGVKSIDNFHHLWYRPGALKPRERVFVHKHLVPAGFRKKTVRVWAKSAHTVHGFKVACPSGKGLEYISWVQVKEQFRSHLDIITGDEVIVETQIQKISSVIRASDLSDEKDWSTINKLAWEEALDAVIKSQDVPGGGKR